MAKYIHIPKNREYGKTVEDWDFLNRHYGHDFGSFMQGISGFVGAWIRGEVDKTLFRDMEIIWGHFENIFHALNAGYGKQFSRNFSMRKLIQESKAPFYLHNDIMFNLKNLENLGGSYNVRNLIYLQYFNFVKNAVEHSFRDYSLLKDKNSITLGAKLFRISDEKLGYLGRNKTFYTAGEVFVQMFAKDNGKGIPENELETIFRTESDLERGGWTFSY